MRKREKETILRKMLKGNITPKRASSLLDVSLNDIWSLVDEYDLGKREMSKIDLSYLNKADAKSIEVMWKHYFPKKKSPAIRGQVRIIRGSTPASYYKPNGYRQVDGHENTGKVKKKANEIEVGPA